MADKQIWDSNMIHLQVDMPVFFYIDPDIVNDPYLYNVKNIALSYTFFEAVEGLDLPFMSLLVDQEEKIKWSSLFYYVRIVLTIFWFVHRE